MKDCLSATSNSIRQINRSDKIRSVCACTVRDDVYSILGVAQYVVSFEAHVLLHVCA
jgi:hypothetical protein